MPTNGKVERSHRIDAEEFYRMLDGVVIDDAGVFNDRLREWEDFYNFNRPHGGLGGQTFIRTTQTEDRQPGVTGLRSVAHPVGKRSRREPRSYLNAEDSR